MLTTSLPHIFFTAAYVHDVTATHVFYCPTSSWLMSSCCVSCRAITCRAVVCLLAKNEAAQKTGKADFSSFIFRVEQLKILKKCRAIACQAIAIWAVDMRPRQHGDQSGLAEDQIKLRTALLILPRWKMEKDWYPDDLFHQSKKRKYCGS